MNGSTGSYILNLTVSRTLLLPSAIFSQDRSREDWNIMLESIIIILLILWLLGFFVVHIGSLVHILLVIALVVIVLRVIQGRKPL